MAVPTPYTWVDGSHPGASVLNPGVRDPAVFLLDPPHVRAYRATSGTALPAGTPTVVNLDGEEYDSTSGMHSLSSNLGRLVAPEDGVYSVVAQVGVVQNSAGSISLDVRLNGTTNKASFRVPTIVSASVSTVISVVTDVPMSAGDYVEMLANFVITASPGVGTNLTYMLARWVTQL